MCVLLGCMEDYVCVCLIRVYGRMMMCVSHQGVWVDDVCVSHQGVWVDDVCVSHQGVWEDDVCVSSGCMGG